MTGVANVFFRQLVHSAFQDARVPLGNPATDYVISLLVDAMGTGVLETPAGHSFALAWYHKEAMASMGQARSYAFRRLGDAALLVAGLFSAYAERTTGLGYYIDMGRGAYRSAAVNRGREHPVMLELSNAFADVVQALNLAARQTTLAAPLGIEQLFELHQRSTGPSAWRELVRRGAIPIIGSADA